MSQTTLNQIANQSAGSSKAGASPGLMMSVAIGKGGKLTAEPTLRLVKFEGTEAVSQPFSYQLEVHEYARSTAPTKVKTFLSSDALAKLVGQPVSVGIGVEKNCSPAILADLIANEGAKLTETKSDEVAVFNGIITQVGISKVGVYHLTMQPSLYRLTLVNNYRIFKQKQLWEVIKDVLTEHGITGKAVDFSQISSGENLATLRKQDWIQAGETDLEFVQKLMQQAHLYYYFKQGVAAHTLVVTNSRQYPSIFVKTGKTVHYTYTDASPVGMDQEDVISSFTFQHKLVAKQVAALVATTPPASAADGYDTGTTLQTSIYQNAPPKQTTPQSATFSSYQTFSYGGSEKEAELYHEEQNRAFKTDASSLAGGSKCKHFRVGHQFEMRCSVDGEDPLSYAEIDAVENQKFVLTSVKHTCTLPGDYSNEFEATPLDEKTQIAPVDLTGTHQGSIVATVVSAPSASAPGAAPDFDAKNFSDSSQNLDYSPDKDPQSDIGAQNVQGVYVSLSTGALDGDTDAIWVRLGASMQTAPAIGSVVLIAPSSASMAEPEIQNTLLERGHKTVTPDSFTPNNTIGNSYNTNYGDSISINMPMSEEASGPPQSVVQAIWPSASISNGTFSAVTQMLDSIWQNGAAPVPAIPTDPSPPATNTFKDVSCAIGASYSISASPTGRAGLLSQSESYGSTYSKTEAAEQRSETNCDTVYTTDTHKNVTSITKITGTQTTNSTIGTSEGTTTIHNYFNYTST